MSDRNRSDAHPDSPPDDMVIDEGRGSVEAPGKPRSPLDGDGIEDGVGGAAGVTRNQDNPTS